MGTPNDDAVLIQKGKKPGEPHVITVNCPDKAGLACDICNTILDFGLDITKADVSTDGKWCFMVFWVVPRYSHSITPWPNLKNRLLFACPPAWSVSVHLSHIPPLSSSSSRVYLLKFFSLDRKGLLHEVTRVLCELELTIQRVKVMTTPDGKVLDLFFITDAKEQLHTKRRHDETCEQLHAVLGESCISFELQLAGPEYESLQGIPSFSPIVAEELFHSEILDKVVHSQALSTDRTKLKKCHITVDNSLSPAHTLLQIHCIDHKGLIYDIMRILKDCNIQIAYGRFSENKNGYRDLDLFVQQKDGKKIVDPDKQSALCGHLKVEILHPLRVIITNKGPDTELLVANPVELSGKGRPRVLYDVTLSLKALEICIFLALASASQRRNLLQELFADIALEVDDRAKDIIFSREEDVISPAEDAAADQLCFYDVLADYYVSVPESGKRILNLIVQLWSQSFASHIFALLFHKWLFEAHIDNNTEVLLRYSSALVQGATNVFWIDIQTNTRRFQTLFQYLLEEVALEAQRLQKIPEQAQQDLFLLLGRFILFYNSADRLEGFLKQFPVSPNAFLIGSPADFFVIELADQLQKLKVEPVLLHYLSQLKVLQGMQLRMTTSTRLKACLYSFTSPGGPMYPTRAVRHAAWDALDLLFPVGRYPRHLISLFFRLLYPWCWPSSCWNFVISCIKAVFYSVLRVLFSRWDKLREAKKY